jgi:hypothetical protein
MKMDAVIRILAIMPILMFIYAISILCETSMHSIINVERMGGGDILCAQINSRTLITLARIRPAANL